MYSWRDEIKGIIIVFQDQFSFKVPAPTMWSFYKKGDAPN